MRTVLILVVLALGSVGGWYFGSPIWTVYQVSEAAKARDSDRLSAYVDYRALRESLRAELRARFTQRLTGRGHVRLGAAAAVLARPVIDRLVDASVTPEALRLMLDTGQATENVRPPFRIDAGNAELVRDSFDQFRIVGQDGAALIFERRGLGWRMAGIRLPLAPNQPAPESDGSNAAMARTIAG